MASWRPRARMCAEVGSSRDPARPLSVTAYQTARAWLEEHGYLGLVARGWTSALAAAALDDGTGTSAVFVLTIPRRPEPLPRPDGHQVNRALARSRSERSNAPRAREARPGVCAAAPWPAGCAPRTRSDEERAAAVVCSRAAALRNLSGRHARHLLRPWLAAGWSPLDVLHALDHDPAGRQHGYTAAVRHPPGWLRSRMALWLDGSGAPPPSPSQRRAAERGRIRAEQSARRTERLRAAERPVDVAAHAARARELLRARQVAGGPAAPRRDGSAPPAPGQERLRRPADRAGPGSGPATAAAKFRQLSGQRAGMAGEQERPG